eukprot:11821307-Alexandrium_andersonii.AAC.1
MARTALGLGVPHRGGECPRGAQRQGCRTPPLRRALVLRGLARLGFGPLGVEGRVYVCGRRPATGDPTRSAGGRGAASASAS